MISENSSELDWLFDWRLVNIRKRLQIIRFYWVLCLGLIGFLPSFATKSWAVGIHDSTLIKAATLNDKSSKANWIPYALVDLYYAQTLNKIDNNYHSPLFQNYNTFGQFAVNQVVLGFKVNSGRYSANLGLHAGNYLADAYYYEPQILRYIRYADIGIALSKAGNLWLNAGIFEAPYGLETSIPDENETLTYSIISADAPFYQTGARLAWSGWKNWYIALWLLNGWGRIQMLPHNSLPSWNMSVTYTNSEKFQLGYNNFIGTDDPDVRRRMRYYQEMHGCFHPTSKWSLSFMCAMGMQQKLKHAQAYYYYGGAEIISSYMLLPSLILAGRMEYFRDLHGIAITNSVLPLGGYAHIYGPSVNLDYKLISHLKLRTEFKCLMSPNSVFKYSDANSQYLHDWLQFTMAVSWHL